MPAAIKTDFSGCSRTYCSQAQAMPWSFVLRLLAAFRGFFARLPKLRLGGVPYGPPIFCRSSVTSFACLPS